MTIQEPQPPREPQSPHDPQLRRDRVRSGDDQHAEVSREVRPVLYAVVCGAGPADHADQLVHAARAAGWDVWVIASRTVAEYFIDPRVLEQASGHPVRTGFRRVGEPGGIPRATAAIVAPATYNTINKWAAGIADTFALSTLAEMTGARAPIVAMPFVNTSFAANAVFRRSVEALRAEGVRLLFEPFRPSDLVASAACFPWNQGIELIREIGWPQER